LKSDGFEIGVGQLTCITKKIKNHFSKHANMQNKYNKKIKIISKTCKKKIEQKN
jgi:hypothetical protein